MYEVDKVRSPTDTGMNLFAMTAALPACECVVCILLLCSCALNEPTGFQQNARKEHVVHGCATGYASYNWQSALKIQDTGEVG